MFIKINFGSENAWKHQDRKHTAHKSLHSCEYKWMLVIFIREKTRESEWEKKILSTVKYLVIDDCRTRYSHNIYKSALLFSLFWSSMANEFCGSVQWRDDKKRESNPNGKLRVTIEWFVFFRINRLWFFMFVISSSKKKSVTKTLIRFESKSLNISFIFECNFFRFIYLFSTFFRQITIFLEIEFPSAVPTFQMSEFRVKVTFHKSIQGNK